MTGKLRIGLSYSSFFTGGGRAGREEGHGGQLIFVAPAGWFDHGDGCSDLAFRAIYTVGDIMAEGGMCGADVYFNLQQLNAGQPSAIIWRSRTGKTPLRRAGVDSKVISRSMWW